MGQKSKRVFKTTDFDVTIMVLDNTGKMKMNYGYEDITELSPVEKQDK
ncbi:hypothetical protein P4534_03485 [Peribacillus butanolivorans]|nr:hypothetical protein [Peribacillus butanolivorans]